MTRPEATECAPYFHRYLDLVPDGVIEDTLVSQGELMVEFLGSLPAQKYDYAYEPGKWTLKEVIGHIIDCERIFQYRALAFARNDKSELPGIEEDEYAAEAGYNKRSMQDVIAEYESVRAATVSLAHGISDEASHRTGTANHQQISVRALIYLISGHELHHLNVIRERYL